MIYNDFKELKLSALGLGCMRLPTTGKYANIDIQATKQMVAYAMEHGINYYDTAWGYHDGNSELVMGEMLADYPRQSFYLASKFPGYSKENLTRVEEIFQRQLEKCRVDYFDFYLFHSVSDGNIDGYLDRSYGVYDYLVAQKQAGRIRHLGFSTHGSLTTIKRFLDAYGKDMEFCQLQINWLDWELQQAKEKVELVSSYGIPVWVMEPVRGGTLATMREDYLARMQSYRPGVPAVEWAFRFLQSLPQVTMTLSGMSNFDQLKQNIDIYSQNKPLTADEMTTILAIASEIIQKETLHCTSCRYCTSQCPLELDIPRFIKLFNEHKYGGGGFITNPAFAKMPADKLPPACIGCQACEAVCPQEIKVSQMMKAFAGRMKK
ncbi:MAG: aldo/keto reductase [Clostridia bacterium]|nr:aldo/keto reductase [Clostridia bacterium]